MGVIDDIKHILILLFENKSRIFEQIYSEFSDEILDHYEYHSLITDNFSKPWYNVYSFNEFHKILEDIDQLVEVVPKPIVGSVFTKPYEKLIIMHNYFKSY